MDKLHTMADALMKYETIDKNQIDDIMDGRTPRPPENWSDKTTPPTAGASSDTKKEAKADDKGDGKHIGGPAGEH